MPDLPPHERRREKLGVVVLVVRSREGRVMGASMSASPGVVSASLGEERPSNQRFFDKLYSLTARNFYHSK